MAPSTAPKREGMSEWKRDQMKKQTPMAEAHPEIVGNELREQQTSKLISLLELVFEAGQALKAKPSFEIQVGQVLVSPGQQVLDKSYHSVDDWKAYFDTRGSNHTFSTFTKILTSNGADMDRAVEMKGLGRNGKGKLWNKMPTAQSVSYEFHCQSRSNEDFQIVVDQQGDYELRKGLITVGTVNIHVPAQIWDLSATLSGPLKWSDPSESVAKSVKTFVESLYVPPNRNKLLLFFRQPDDHEIKVRNLIVKRVSYHASHRPDGQHILLKVTEAKNLQFRVHQLDKRLWQAYEVPEGDYKNQIADKGRIHYEMSIVHDGINEVLAKNESLEIGELTDAGATGKALLDHPVILSMLDTAVQMVSRIDYMGMWNYGTQKRLAEEDRAYQEQLGVILGPKGRTILQGGNTSIVRGSTMGGSRAHVSAGTNAGGPTVVQQAIPGVRMNTQAEVKVDDRGNRFLLGMGGARIPMIREEEPVHSALTVMPDDSASQFGGRAQMQFGASYRSIERGPGFW